MLARMDAPASRGTNMVLSRFVSKGPGCMATADPDAPRIWHRMKGIVNMPSRLDETVRSSARAVLPPTVCRQVSTSAPECC